MKLIHHPDDLKAFVREAVARNKSVGFVPTMGALHSGHISLAELALDQCDVVVVSIFVNPAQFNVADDLEKYPRKPKKDLSLLQHARVHAVFMPSVKDMYPPEEAIEHYDLGVIETEMEGRYRPGHFQGVAAIIHKFLRLFEHPVKLYMGLKDYQQVCVVNKLISQKNLSAQLIPCPTVRDVNGLALSSRNERLSTEGTHTARHIYKTLKWLGSVCGEMKWKEARKTAREKLNAAGIETEYLEIALPLSLEVLSNWPRPGQEVVICFAGYLEGVRLIDNITVGVKA